MKEENIKEARELISETRQILPSYGGLKVRLLTRVLIFASQENWTFREYLFLRISSIKKVLIFTKSTKIREDLYPRKLVLLRYFQDCPW